MPPSNHISYAGCALCTIYTYTQLQTHVIIITVCMEFKVNARVCEQKHRQKNTVNEKLSNKSASN